MAYPELIEKGFALLTKSNLVVKLLALSSMKIFSNTSFLLFQFFADELKKLGLTFISEKWPSFKREGVNKVLHV